MRTDIFPTFFSLGATGPVRMQTDSLYLLMRPETQKKRLSSNTLTLFGCLDFEKFQIFSGQRPKRPELELFDLRPFTAPAGFHSF